MAGLIRGINHNLSDQFLTGAAKFFTPLRREMDSLAELLDAQAVYLVDASEGLTPSQVTGSHEYALPHAAVPSHGIRLPLGRNHYLFVENGNRNLLRRQQSNVSRAKRRIQSMLLGTGPEPNVSFGVENLIEFGHERSKRSILRGARALREVLEEEIAVRRIQLYYQPKVCLSTGRLTGYEALLRWVVAENTICTPDTFQEILSCRDCGPVLSRFVLSEALDQARAWQVQGFEFGRIAINVGQFEIDDFRNISFADRVLSGLRDRNLTPRVLDIEITEAVDFEKAPWTFAAQLRELAAHGVEVSLDDFGTGFASLKHVLTVPFTQVKIDREFVSRITTDVDVRTLVQCLVNWGRALDKKIVAEGVETREQIRLLQDFGVDTAQGYFFGKPLPSHDCKTAMPIRLTDY